MNFTKAIQEDIRTRHLFERGDHVLLAVSGGADSTALLHVLAKLRHLLGIRLSVAHINHQLREDSLRDEKFVRSFCDQLHIPCLVKRVIVSKRPGKSSIEELAREKRLGALCTIAQKIHADCIVLAHHRDDLAETVMMRIIRGTGLSGLQGIRCRHTINGHTIVRPLLNIARQDIMRYLKQNRVPYREDLSNKSRTFTRNKIRHDLLPDLAKHYNPQITGALTGLAETTRADYEYLAQQTRLKFAKLANLQVSAATVNFPRKPFERLHPGLQRMLIRHSIEHLKGNTNRLEFKHFQALESLLAESPKNTQLKWPQGISIKLTPARLTVSRRKT